MSLITLVFSDPESRERTILKKISSRSLFEDGASKDVLFTAYGQRVRVRYINNLLAIDSTADVDIIFNCKQTIPVSGIFIKTAGYLEVKGITLCLDFGLWAIAENIQLDSPILNKGFLRLDTSEIDFDGNVSIGSVKINEAVESDSLIIRAQDLIINSNVAANSANIIYNSLTIELMASLCIGKDQVVFKKLLTDSHSVDVTVWGYVTQSASTRSEHVSDFIDLCGNAITQNGILKLSNAQLKNKGDITYGAASKTIYDDVNIFSSGGMQSHLKSVINGRNVYFQFENDVDIAGECKIDNLTFSGRNLTVTGVLWGGPQLYTHFRGAVVNNGVIGSEISNVIGNTILTSLVKNDKNFIFGIFTQGGIIGTTSLTLNALGMMVAGGGYIKSPNIQYRVGVFVNLVGVVSSCSTVDRSIFSIDLGLNIPCLPNSTYDLASHEKIFRLSCRVMGNSFPMLRNAATLGSLAAPLGGMIKSGVVTTANGVSNVAVGLYYNPKKQAQSVVDGANYLKDGLSASPGAVSEAVKIRAKSVSDGVSNVYNEGLIKKSQDGMKKISDSWNKTRWLDLFNYLLTLQDWYISADMIVMKGTNALVFLNDAKTCIKAPRETLNGIANNLSVINMNIKSSLADPNLAKNLSDAAFDEFKKLKEIPANAVNKIGSQMSEVANAVANPVESMNRLGDSFIQTVNSVTLENAKKGLLDPIQDKKSQLLKASNNLFFGESMVAESSLEKPSLEDFNNLNSEETQMPIVAASDLEKPPVEDSNNLNSEESQKTTAAESNQEASQADAKESPVEKKSSMLRKAIIDGIVIFAPYIDRRTAVSINLGVTITGSEMEDTLFSSHNGVSIALASSNHSVFGYHNSGGIYSYNRNEVVGNRYNTGDVHVNYMNLSATNNEEHGDFQPSEFIFDIKRNFNTSSVTKMSEPGLFSGKIGGDFYGASDFVFSHGRVEVGGNYTVAEGAKHVVAGDAQLRSTNAEIYGNLTTKDDSEVHFKNGVVFEGGKYINYGTVYGGDSLTFSPGSGVELIDDLINVSVLDDQGAQVFVKDHITLAKNLKRSGNWTYKGFLHEQVDELQTTTDSKLEKTDKEDTYSLQAKRIDVNGSEKHSYVQASVDEMSTSEAVAYGLGNDKYSGIEVTESIYVTTQSEEAAEYIGTRDNGAHVQIQTNGRITLPPQFERARGMIFASYEDAAYFALSVYPTYNLPPPEVKKPSGLKKHLKNVSKFFGAVASVFASGGNPVTLAISAVSASAAAGTDMADKHYKREANRELEKRQLERVKLQQRLDNEGLAMQQQSALSSLTSHEHTNRVSNAANVLLNQTDAVAVSNVVSLEDAKQEVIQQYAAARQELNDQTQRQLTDIAYHNARHRDNISLMDGPVVGGGIAVRGGSSGVTTYATITAGNPGQVVTGGIPVANHDFSRPRTYDSKQNETATASRQLPRIEEVVDEDNVLSNNEVVNNTLKLTNLNVGLSVDERLALSAPLNPYSVNSKVTIEEIYTYTDTFLSDIQLAPEDLSRNTTAAISPEARYQFSEKPMIKVLFAAIDGNIYAKQEMRRRAETLAKFFDSIDPDLKPLASDNVVMAELKMYGRSAKNVRDQFVHAVTKPHEVAKDTFILGADIIEAGLYYYGGKDYYHPAHKRNDARMAAFELLLHADGLTQREVILTAGLSAIMSSVPGRATRSSVVAKPGKPILTSFEKKSQGHKLDFAPTGYLDGQLYPKEKFPILGEYLYKRGVDIITITKGSPAFQAANPLTGRSTLYLPASPTVLQIKHELSHWLDCKALGVEKYSKLSTLEKEQMVLDRLKNNRVWSELSKSEKNFSKWYVEDLKPDLSLEPKKGAKNVN